MTAAGEIKEILATGNITTRDEEVISSDIVIILGADYDPEFAQASNDLKCLDDAWRTLHVEKNRIRHSHTVVEAVFPDTQSNPLLLIW